MSNRHTISIYRYQIEKNKVSLSYIENAIKNNTKSVFVSNKENFELIVNELSKKVSDIKEVIKKGALLFLDEAVVYNNGKIQPLQIIKIADEIQSQAKNDGFDNVLFIGETPILNSEADESEIIDYEQKLDNYLNSGKAIVVCQYNETTHSDNVLLKLLQAHNEVIIYGEL
jgi:hypothetical protein